MIEINPVALMMKLVLRFLIVAGICSLSLLFPKISTAQNLGFYFEKGKKKVSIPFETHNNLIVIPVTLNEKHRLKFILDTGVRNTIFIDKKLTDKLEFEYEREIKLYGAGDSIPLKAFVTGEVSLSMPGIKSEGISTVVLEKDILQLEHHLGIKIHGLIGYDIFSRFIVKIDYMHEKIILQEPLQYKVRKKYEAIDLEIIESKPFTNLNLHLIKNDTVPTKLLIDTGASHALVLDINSNSRINLPEKYIEASLGRGLAGEIEGYLARIDGFTIGKERLSGVIASFTKETLNGQTSRTERNGTIGGELLKKFTVIFNFYDAKMYVKPNRTFRFPFEYNMSGLEFTAEGEKLNQYLISNVREDSPGFNAGFKAGDILIVLNDITSKKLDLSKIYTKLNLKEGKKINMTVYRDGKYISKTFHLKREI